jgi:hypothetical protein
MCPCQMDNFSEYFPPPPPLGMSVRSTSHKYQCSSPCVFLQAILLLPPHTHMCMCTIAYIHYFYDYLND